MEVLTDGQKGYIAGFMEGEGSFFLNGNRYITPHIAVAQKRPEVLVYMKRLLEVGRIIYVVPKSGRGYFRYTIDDGRSIVDFIKEIYHFLVSPRTKKRAWCVYQVAKLIRDYRSSQPLPEENIEKRREAYSIWKSTRR